MKGIVFSTYLFFFLTLIPAFAQDKNASEASESFENYAFINAIDVYESLVKKGITNKEIFENLGDANYLNARYEEAAKWYSQLFKLDRENLHPDYYYRYAQSLKSAGAYEESDKWMTEFEKKINIDDSRASKFMSSQKYWESLKNQPERYKITPLTFNSGASDFAPSLNGNQLVFASTRDSGLAVQRTHNWTNSPFLDLYKVDISGKGNIGKVAPFSKRLNTGAHESSTTFSKDGNTVYFTRNNSSSGSFNRDNAGISRLKLFVANKRNGQWANIRELPFNSEDHSVAHPTLSADGKKLYFASNMPGSLGNSDIFYVDVNENGTYGKPVNMGPNINTEARETFPFVADSGILYFASDGHPGLGGLDIFATELENNGGDVINLGEPINSTQDDFSFIIDEKTKRGFFASNRAGGFGNDDIYRFQETSPLVFECLNLISGTTADKENGKPIENVTVTVIGDTGEVLKTVQSNHHGNFKLKVNCESEVLLIKTQSNYYYPSTKEIIVSGREKRIQSIGLTKRGDVAPKGSDLIEFLKLEPIWFNTSKWDIRSDAKPTLEKILEYLIFNPEIKLHIASHTDAIGSASRNLRLSENRAVGIMKYLIDRGADSSRLSAKGYGEEKLTNGCFDDLWCTEKEHQENRRTEFIVVEE